MNTLTQQQFNLYQWQVADGVARPVNPHVGYVFAEADKDYIFEQNQLFEKFKEFAKQHRFQTNAPDGIYSGEAFELEHQGRYESGWFKISELVYRNYIANPIDLLVEDVRQFLRLKPSHLPAVLTTQPGDEWKYRYREVWLESFNGGAFRKKPPISMRYFKDFDVYVKSLGTAFKAKREWHLITPPAEQEAETVEPKKIKQLSAADEYSLLHDEWHRFEDWSTPPYRISDKAYKAFIAGAEWQSNQLQSTLTQKDQRIAELERKREWISVGDRLPEDKTRVLCVAVHPNGNRWIQIYRYSTDIGFDWMHDYEPILWMPLPTPPQH